MDRSNRPSRRERSGHPLPAPRRRGALVLAPARGARRGDGRQRVHAARRRPGTPAPWWDRLTGATDPVAAHARAPRGGSARRSRPPGRAPSRSTCSTISTGRELSPRAPGWSGSAMLLAPGALVLCPGRDDGSPRPRSSSATRRSSSRGPARSLALYADLPHAIRRGWPAWVTGAPESPRTRRGRGLGQRRRRRAG